MIQRIQSVYLLLASVLIGAMFLMPFAEIANAQNQIYEFNATGIVEEALGIMQNGWAIAGLIGIILLIHLLSIFLYKNRILQMRILVFAILLSFGLMGLLFFFVHRSFDDVTISYHLPMAFPVVVAIFDYLAIRGIAKDEAMIRSLDRIR
ncbi:MAG: DUF4293 domain-containing protein [Mangrovibacterium sp.]